jgi:pre-mRNA-splicing factor CWC26
MKDYLKRYQSSTADKKTKKKPKPAAAGGGVLIVDEDPVWQKPAQIEEDDPTSSGTPPFPCLNPRTLN